MTKLLLLAVIILIAFWLGKMSAAGKRREITRRDSEPDRPVIDIESEDK